MLLWYLQIYILFREGILSKTVHDIRGGDFVVFVAVSDE